MKKVSGEYLRYPDPAAWGFVINTTLLYTDRLCQVQGMPLLADLPGATCFAFRLPPSHPHPWFPQERGLALCPIAYGATFRLTSISVALAATAWHFFAGCQSPGGVSRIPSPEQAVQGGGVLCAVLAVPAASYLLCAALFRQSDGLGQRSMRR